MEHTEPGLDRPARGDLGGRWTRWLTIPIYTCCALAFLTDVFYPVFVLFGLFYLPLVCTAVFYRDPRSAWWLAMLASMLIMIGFFFPIMNPETTIAIINRCLSIAAIFITAALVRHARRVRDRLIEQTARAEAGERLKTEVFTALSTELRQPLHSLAGLAAVMRLNCRPDQRDALNQVQHDSQRLAAMIDNLIDLTRIDDRTFESTPVDVDLILRQAAESAGPMAAERQIMVALDEPEDGHHTAHGDPWAIRRIVDNILTNALRYSPPGSVVELTTENTTHGVSVIIRDTGNGIPEPVLRRLTEPRPRADADMGRYFPGAGLGLTLCRGLARATGAELVIDSEIGSGTTVTLLLPA